MEAQRSWIARGVVSRVFVRLGLSTVMIDRLGDSEFSNNHSLSERDTPFIRPGLDLSDPVTTGVIAPKFVSAYPPFADHQYVTVSTYSQAVLPGLVTTSPAAGAGKRETT